MGFKETTDENDAFCPLPRPYSGCHIRLISEAFRTKFLPTFSLSIQYRLFILKELSKRMKSRKRKVTPRRKKKQKTS